MTKSVAVLNPRMKIDHKQIKKAPIGAKIPVYRETNIMINNERIRLNTILKRGAALMKNPHGIQLL